MAAFLYQQQLPFLPNSNCLQPHQAHQAITNGYSYYFPSESIAEVSTPHESISSLDSGSKASVVRAKVLKAQSSLEKKKKKGRVGCCFSSIQSNKDAKESKGRKKKQKQARDGEVEDSKACDHIHVRAKRGQATDSHSLAERVRRAKISLKFKVLQGLVPGCDKVVGKALLLDEIINYVQSLQNQVEFLSMKLASMNPLLHDFGMDFDDLLIPQEADGSSLPVQVEFHNMCSFQ